MKNTTSKMVYAALLGALVFLGTQFLKVPLAIGYVHMGDCFVLLLGWVIGGPYAMIGAAIGAGLADLLSGYVMYMPFTMVIKAFMAWIAYKGYQKSAKKSYWMSAVMAEICMVLGYYMTDGFLYGFAAALTGIPGNCFQGVIAVLIGVLIMKKMKGRWL